MDVAKSLQFLGLKPSKNDVRLIIWEVDDDLDGYVSHEEFFTMYKKTFKGSVTVEETLQILFVRYGRDRLDEEIRAIFGDDEKDADGVEKSIKFSEYVSKINTRALTEYKHKLELKNKKKIPISGMGDEEEQ